MDLLINLNLRGLTMKTIKRFLRDLIVMHWCDFTYGKNAGCMIMFLLQKYKSDLEGKTAREIINEIRNSI